MLMDVCCKIFLTVISGRAICLLELHGTKFQFRGTLTLQCQDGLFTLKTLLDAHKNQHLPSFVAFVNLVEAYDTTNHDLLLKILEKYGAPPKFVDAIRTMYTDLKIVLKFGKEICEFLQSVGVQQGNNIAPVLFLFLMLAVTETLKIVWKKAGIKVLMVAHTPDDELTKAACTGTPPACILPANLLPLRSSSYSTWMMVPSPSQLALIKRLSLFTVTLPILA
jgi:hypothetical protein